MIMSIVLLSLSSVISSIIGWTMLLALIGGLIGIFVDRSHDSDRYNGFGTYTESNDPH
jgi:hypothetical protein